MGRSWLFAWGSPPPRSAARRSSFPCTSSNWAVGRSCSVCSSRRRRSSAFPAPLVFGNLADRTGKRRPFVLAALVVATATTLVIPTLESVPRHRRQQRRRFARVRGRRPSAHPARGLRRARAPVDGGHRPTERVSGNRLGGRSRAGIRRYRSRVAAVRSGHRPARVPVRVRRARPRRRSRAGRASASTGLRDSVGTEPRGSAAASARRRGSTSAAPPSRSLLPGSTREGSVPGAHRSLLSGACDVLRGRSRRVHRLRRLLRATARVPRRRRLRVERDLRCTSR